MAAVAEVTPTRALRAGLIGGGLVCGLLAGVNPVLGIGAAVGIGFVALLMSDLAVGVTIFAFLTFLDALPVGAAPVSLAKLAGVLLAISWLAMLAVRPGFSNDFVSAHPGFTYVLLLFVGWSAISITWAEDSAKVIDAVFRYLPNAMLFLIVFSAIRTRRQTVWVVGAFVIGALASAIFGLLTGGGESDEGRLGGAAGNPNEIAALLVAGAALAGALVVALRGRPALRLGAAIAAPLCIYALFLTVSRGGLVALGAALLAAIAMGGRWRPAAIGLTVVAALCTVLYFGAFASQEARARVTEVGSGTGRTDIWAVGWRMVGANTLQGVGAGNFNTSSIHYLLEPGVLRENEFVRDKPKEAHNTYLEVVAELGVVGLALFLAIVGFSVLCMFRAARAFARERDLSMEIIARAVLVAVVGLLAADFFGSREYSKQLWLLLSLGPVLLALARGPAGRADQAPVRG
jgi:O-antigen ligase